ncbi:transcriptional regulator, SARP family [Alloactinosynnema sp. L-07]|uniref:ATP-binding protein n=1 Tax=Alloactinosynnema sp. L-07 TaxID=1653480 RepID=UPI00065F0973|nr:tetratricopeptide repeat protein [Alloactinosynnema sp. L-07]CRK57685.1 transcriptional regulator, SARP family [Alloactinosynnema sp. L-07]
MRDDAAALRQALADDLTLLVIRAERLAGHGLDRVELARRILVSPSSLYAYLKGETVPSADVFARLLEALGVHGPNLGVLSSRRDAAELARRRGKAAARTAASGHVPQQLPALVDVFVGRATEIDCLDRILCGPEPGDGPVVISIDGVAGVGKTTLAVRWAHQVAARYADGVLHVNLRGFDEQAPMPSGEALHGFLHALGVTSSAIPATVDAKAALYRTLVAGRRVLVLADNARSANHVRPLLPGASGSLVIVTSRTRLDGLAIRDGARRVTLDVLSHVESADLLTRRLGAESTTASSVAVAELAQLCGGLPLALGIVAARAAALPGEPLNVLVAGLRSHHERLDALDLGEPDVDMRSVFRWSYDVLPERAAELFRLIGLHPGPDIDRYACAVLLGADQPPRTELGVLCAANLLVEKRSGRYGMHDLLRVYAQELAGGLPSAGRAVILTRLADHYVGSVEQVGELIQPNQTTRPSNSRQVPIGPSIEGYAQAMEWFAAELPNLRAMVTFAAAEGLESHAWRIAWGCTVFLRRTGRRSERAAIHRVALDAALRAGDRLAYATTLRLLADAIARSGSPADALDLLHTALAEFETLGDRDGARQTHLSLVRAYEVESRPAAAFQHAEMAVRLAAGGGDQLAKADGLTALSKQTCATRPADARALGLRALALYSQVGHLEGEADILMTLGLAEQSLGRYAEAMAHYQRSLDLDRQLGDRYWEACALDRLADVHYLVDDVDQARSLRREAIGVLDGLHHPHADVLRAKLDADT